MPATAPEPVISDKQSKLFWLRCAERAKAFAEAGVTRVEIARDVLRLMGLEHTRDMTARSFERALEFVEAFEPGKYAVPAVAEEPF